MDISTYEAELATLKLKTTELVTEVKASNRNLTDAEIKGIEKDTARIDELKGLIAFTKSHPNGALQKGIGIGSDFGDFRDESIGGAFAHDAKGFVTPAAVKQMVAAGAAPLAKALVAGGSSATAVQFDSNPLVLATPPANLGLLGVIPVVKRSTPTYSYLRQSIRTNNAAVVPAGTQKPTSIFTTESINATLQVVTHLSEYVDTYLLKDNANLESFLASELQSGIFQKVTALAVAAYAGTAGITTQAFTTNTMDSLYLGAGKAYDLGYNPDVVLISRADYDAIALAKDTAGNYLYKRDEDSRINGLYPVIATGLPAKSAIILDSSKVAISTDTEGILTKWDPYTKLDYNQVRALVEGRFQFDVLAAPSIVKVGTAA